MVEFGEQLRKAREAKGMTQQSLAEKLYVTRQAVSRWECGERFPDLKTTKQISDILEVSLDDLLSGNEMEKVIERNPVIEKPLVNNIMVALYACIVFSISVQAMDIIIRLLTVNLQNMGYNTFQTVVTELTGLAAQAAVFTYGFITALKGMLSPKRMGLVIVVFFASMILLRTHYAYVIFHADGIKTPLTGLVYSVITIIPGIVGAVSSYMFFVKAKPEKIWWGLIVVCACLGIVGTIGNIYASLIKGGAQLLSQNELIVNSLLSTYALSICKYALIVYQTCALQKKRNKVKAVDVEMISDK